MGNWNQWGKGAIPKFVFSSEKVYNKTREKNAILLLCLMI